MPLILANSHPIASQLGATPGDSDAPRLRIGILNIMPRLEAYEPSLLGPLSRVPRLIEPVFVRLESHGYGSSDQQHLARHYLPFDRVLAGGAIDGLILTGAPVEELPFKEVRYWRELGEILGYARGHVRSTLGICWGGLALGGLLGIEKTLFPRKLFGVFDNRVLVDGHPLLRAPGGSFRCAHSRHSGVVDDELERAQADGRVRLLSYAPETGYSIFETPDHRYLMHLGHPEYDGARLVFEWERDAALGRPDVEAPRNFDTRAPVTSWHDHREGLLATWTDWLARPTG
jgi:homoserine O-succinyltransferase/O-acetyltransferase